MRTMPRTRKAALAMTAAATERRVSIGVCLCSRSANARASTTSVRLNRTLGMWLSHKSGELPTGRTLAGSLNASDPEIPSVGSTATPNTPVAKNAAAWSSATAPAVRCKLIMRCPLPRVELAIIVAANRGIRPEHLHGQRNVGEPYPAKLRDNCPSRPGLLDTWLRSLG